MYSSLVKKILLLSIFTLPFSVLSQDGGGIEEADKIYNALGLKFLPMGNTGNQMGGCRRYTCFNFRKISN